MLFMKLTTYFMETVVNKKIIETSYSMSPKKCKIKHFFSETHETRSKREMNQIHICKFLTRIDGRLHKINDKQSKYRMKKK